MLPHLLSIKYVARYAIPFALSTVSLFALYTLYGSKSQSLKFADAIYNKVASSTNPIGSIRNDIFSKSAEFINNPLPSTAFGRLGTRTATVLGWIDAVEEIPRQGLDPETRDDLWLQIEKTVTSLYPFLAISDGESTCTPLENLRSSFTGDHGIVLPTSSSSFRFAVHLIQNLRNVLHSELPIEIAYAGDTDLSMSQRDVLTSLGPNISTLNVLEKFYDASLNLAVGGWAIKPFAALASSFRNTILLDADAVFLQDPSVGFEDSRFQETGVLFFHDRMLWQNVFKDRAKWWREEMAAAGRNPCATLMHSKVWAEGYAEEMDSGAVFLDKGRWNVLLGLLHICWQNSKKPRDAVTYKITYGDKESWWLGMELVGTPYAMEQHYGSVLGQIDRSGSREKVCAFSIAHVDQRDKLFWFNGSLLKNKSVNVTEYMSSEAWMMDALWVKGATKQDLSCMIDGPIRGLDENVISVLQRSIENAREADHRLQQILGLPL